MVVLVVRQLCNLRFVGLAHREALLRVRPQVVQAPLIEDLTPPASRENVIDRLLDYDLFKCAVLFVLGLLVRRLPVMRLGQVRFLDDCVLLRLGLILGLLLCRFLDVEVQRYAAVGRVETTSPEAEAITQVVHLGVASEDGVVGVAERMQAAIV